MSAKSKGKQNRLYIVGYEENWSLSAGWVKTPLYILYISHLSPRIDYQRKDYWLRIRSNPKRRSAH